MKKGKKQKSAWAYIKGYKFNSLLIRNMAYIFVLVAVPLLLVVSLNYEKFNDEVNERMMDMNDELLQKNAVVADNIMQDILNILEEISHRSDIMDVVQAEANDGAYHNKVVKARALLEKYTLSNNYIESAHIYSDLNQMVVNKVGSQNLKKEKDKEKWYYIHKSVPMDEPYFLVNDQNSIFACQPLLTQEGQRAGVFVLDVRLQKIRDLLESEEVSQRGMFFIVDISGSVMYCSDLEYFSLSEEKKLDYTGAIARVKPGESKLVAESGGIIVSVMESTHKSWKYALVTERPAYTEEVQTIENFLFSSVFVGVFTSILGACIITLITYRPMKKIINVIENPQIHWDEEASKESNELLYITSNILNTLNAKEEMSKELEMRVQNLRQAQFRALQFQIDPHFLYNTLETIKWNAIEEMGFGNKTSKMLTKMARLYRAGLENDDVIITLKEEIEFLKLYIDIVQIRFGDAITFHWDIDERLQDCMVIKMCLQPLVENAINHGLRPKSYRGNITISAYEQKEKLYISVTNDGEGMSEKDIRELNRKFRTGIGFDGNKVGLRNVNERIKLIYGTEYGVHLGCTESNVLNGSDTVVDTWVVITFPYRQ